MGILSGLRIVEGSAFIAAPLGGMTLAQLGADVIRFDPIGGGIDYRRWPVTADGTSLYWAGLNKGKRSLQVDIRRPEGRELVLALINLPGADNGIFLTNFPPEGWLAFEAVRRRDDLIMVNIVGNPDGSTALDYSVNAALGFPFATGPTEWQGPINHVLPAWDLLCAQTAATAILAAERHRTRTGGGQYVRIALADIGLAATATLGYTAEIEINGRERPMSGNDVYGAFGRDFATADGRHVMVAAISAGQWKALVAATGIAEQVAALEALSGLDFGREGDRYQGRDLIAGLIRPIIAARPLSELVALFERHRVLWGPYQSFTQLLREDWRCSTRNPLFSEIEHPGIGRILTPGSPIAFGAVPREPPGPAPRLGAHTDEILADLLGLDGAAIGRLHDAGVVAGPA